MVGNHNFCDSACTDGVQKGEEETGPLPVEIAPRVRDDFVIGIDKREVGTLSLKIGALMGGADASVAHETLRFRFFDMGDTKDTLDVAPVIEALPLATLGTHGFNLAVLRPEPKRARIDIIGLADGGGSNVLRLQKLGGLEEIGENDGGY